MMSSSRSRRTRAVALVSTAATLLIVGLFARPISDESTPWQFLHAGLAHADSVGKTAGLVFFTIVLVGMNLMASLARLRMGLVLPVVLFGAAAVSSARVRRSRLVRIGVGLGILGVVPLVLVGTMVTDNPVGLGFLFAFLMPVAAILIISGTVLALTTHEPADRCGD